MKTVITGVVFMAMSTFAYGQAPREAIFAGGCFWCMEPPFEQLEGVIEVVAGYTGGTVPDPTYDQVGTGKTGHVEAVRVTYNPARISYGELVEVFWRNVDPTDAGGQFADRGSQYATALFYADESERAIAQASRERLEQSGRFKKPVVVPLRPVTAFYPAEGYHQNYYQTNPQRYERYKTGSGRAAFLKVTWPASDNSRQVQWNKPPEKELKKRLSAEQYRVTQECGTERPYDNAFWNNHRAGLYVDVVSGEPLFSSIDKFDSRTGWPSFSRPVDPAAVAQRTDTSHGMRRVEVRSSGADSHLGHLFDDGPMPGGLRYCINSAALRFIPREDLEKEGYGRWVHLFE